MIQNLQIRKSCSKDMPSIRALYTKAFPDEDLLPLIGELLDNRDDILSLVGIINSSIISHVAFTICDIEATPHKVALLAPLCVTSSHQKNGIGIAIVKNGFEQIKAQQITCALVLGDPTYYSRLGFTTEKLISPPYPLPEEWSEAWQSIQLIKNTDSPNGKLHVPAPWRRPELWS